MKRPRPYIPVDVRCYVVLRQVGDLWPDKLVEESRHNLGALLSEKLVHLAATLGCEVRDLRLDHNPALILREFNRRTGRYKPDANDWDFLIYRTAHDHHLKTNVRGDGALRSDTAARMHQRRMDENRGKRKRRPKAKIKSRSFASVSGAKLRGGKRKWPKRGFR